MKWHELADTFDDSQIVETDVVVAGGGPAGIAATVAAARNGAKTIVLERYGFLGGMATAGMVEELAGLYSSVPTRRGEELGRVVGGIAAELVDRMVEYGGAEIRSGGGHVPGRGFIPFDAEIFKYVADRLVLEAGAKPLLHSYSVDTIT